MRKIAVEIECGKKYCGDCQCQDRGLCHAFKKERSGLAYSNVLKAKRKNGVTVDFYRLPECLNAEVKK